MQSLSSFTGNLYKKYPTVELLGLLQSAGIHYTTAALLTTRTAHTAAAAAHAAHLINFARPRPPRRRRFIPHGITTLPWSLRRNLIPLLGTLNSAPSAAILGWLGPPPPCRGPGLTRPASAAQSGSSACLDLDLFVAFNS